MSTLEKAIILLREMPEQSVETVYHFMQSMQPQLKNTKPLDVSAFGIAHKYANPALIEKRRGLLKMPWSKNIQLIDANVILRYLLNDSPEMSMKAKSIVESGAYTKPEFVNCLPCIER